MPRRLAMHVSFFLVSFFRVFFFAVFLFFASGLHRRLEGVGHEPECRTSGSECTETCCDETYAQAPAVVIIITITLRRNLSPSPSGRFDISRRLPTERGRKIIGRNGRAVEGLLFRRRLP